MKDLEVKSIDGVEAPDAAALKQPETPVVEEKKSKRNEAGDIVINLDTLETDAIQEPKAEEIPLQPKADSGKEASEAPKEGEKQEEEEVRSSDLGKVHNPEEDETSKPTLERVEDGDESPTTAQKPEKVSPQSEAPQLPENVDKLVTFMQETGGTVEDYVNLNKDISKLDDVDVMKEYYKQKSPHLDDDDISFTLDEKFLFDEEEDTERAIRAKKLAFKEELYDARKYLGERKDKYYAELKSGPNQNLTAETQEAVQFYNDQKQSKESMQKLNDVFLDRTEKLFNEDFKGFDFKVGDSKFRVNVGDAQKVKADQVDLNKFITKFVGEDGSITDPAGYHKAMYVANNVDAVANHFYEQGRADAVKQNAAEAKNINMGGRSDMSSSPSTQSGPKIRVLDTPSDGEFRIKSRR